MRIPEKTVLGVSAVLLSLSSLQVMARVMNGRIAADMQATAAHMHSPYSFQTGFMIGFAVVLGIKVLASIGLWILLVKRLRTSGEPA